MDIVAEIHKFLSQTVWMYFLGLGLLGIYRALRRESVDGAYLGAMAIAEALFIIQGVLGTLLYLSSARPERPGIHLLYGAFAILFLPFMYFVVLRGEQDNRSQWVMGLSALFLMGIAFRAIGTG